MDWVKVGKLSYYIPSLTLEDKVRLGLNDEVLKELEEIQPEVKTAPCKKSKKSKTPEIQEDEKDELQEDDII